MAARINPDPDIVVAAREYAGQTYFPKLLPSRDRQVNCNCLCHEGIPEHGSGPCPCKIGGWHEGY